MSVGVGRSVPTGAGGIRQRAARLGAVVLAVVVLLAGWAATATAAPFSRTTQNGVNNLRADTLTSPGTPVPLRVSAASGMTTLNWTASKSYASYRIDRSTSPTGPFSEIALLPPDPAGFTEFALPAGTEPHGIATGRDGALWFTSRSSNQIGRITRSGSLTWYAIPTPDSRPETIVAGPDGALWFTETAGDKIGRIAVDGTLSEFPVPGSVPKGITSGKDGHLYFTARASKQVFRITTGGVITELVTLPDSSVNPGAIAWGPDGNLWVTNGGTTGISRVTPAGDLTELTLPTTSSAPAGIAVGPLGNLFVTESAGDKIGKFSPYFDSFTVEEFGLTAGRGPTGITAGSDRNMWFTERNGNRIGRVTSTGTVTEFSVPTSGSAPTAITAGPDGALWFTEAGTNKIGRYALGPTTTFTDTTAVGDQHYYYRMTAVYMSWTTPQNQVAMSLSMSPSSATDQTEPATPVAADTVALARGDNAAYTTTGDWRTNWTLRGVDTRDGVRVWAVGDGGLMALSTDGGATWKQQPAVTSVNLARVRFLNVSTGWAVGEGGTILATTDGGATWSTQTSGTTVTLRDIAFLNATTGWAVGDGGTILRWNGTQWSPSVSSTTEILRGVAAASSTRVWVVGDRGTVATFNGTSWSSIEINGQPPLYDVAAVSANRGWAVGAGGRIIALEDGSFTNTISGTSQTLYAVAGVGTSAVWAAGANGTIRYFNGSSWSGQTSGTSAEISGLSFTDASTGFYVTAGARPGRTTNGGSTWTGPQPKSFNVTFPAAAVASGAAVNTLRATLVYRTSAVPSTDAIFRVSASFDGGATWTDQVLSRPTSTATVTQTVNFASPVPSAAALQANGMLLRFLVTSSNVFSTTHDAIRVDVN